MKRFIAMALLCGMAPLPAAAKVLMLAEYTDTEPRQTLILDNRCKEGEPGNRALRSKPHMRGCAHRLDKSRILIIWQDGSKSIHLLENMLMIVDGNKEVPIRKGPPPQRKEDRL
jgi:hypothetical protein